MCVCFVLGVHMFILLPMCVYASLVFNVYTQRQAQIYTHTLVTVSLIIICKLINRASEEFCHICGDSLFLNDWKFFNGKD
jgi:uncharacterized protein YqhQ